MATDDPGEHVGEISLRVDAIHFAGCDQQGQDCPMFGAAVGAGEEVILAAERNASNAYRLVILTKRSQSRQHVSPRYFG
jgi:hypothetical protein